MARFLEALLGASLETAAQTPETLAESLETAALTPETLAARRESNGAAGTSGLDETNGTGDGKGNGQRSQSLLAFREEGFEGLDTGLNEEQRRAVRLCVNGPEDGGGSPVALLHGPFGTGKTRTLVEVIRQRVRAGEFANRWDPQSGFVQWLVLNSRD